LTVLSYGQRIQYYPLPDASPPETSQAITHIQCIVGTFLYNARAVEPNLLAPLSTLASQLSTATSATIYAVSYLLDYCITNLEPSIRYYASGMQLKIHSDAFYLSEPKATSRIGGYFYLGNKTEPPNKTLSNVPLLFQTHIFCAFSQDCAIPEAF
jgi:hypothetical protein